MNIIMQKTTNTKYRLAKYVHIMFNFKNIILNLTTKSPMIVNLAFLTMLLNHACLIRKMEHVDTFILTELTLIDGVIVKLTNSNITIWIVNGAKLDLVN